MNDANDKLKEIFRDLRNQRLLPVIAILVVAIFAVPMALKAGGTEPAPPTELAAGLKPMLETEPVVLTATPELRDFRTRLDESSKKNPFHQPTPVPVSNPDDAAAESSSTGSTDATGTGTVPSDTTVPSDDTTVPPDDTTVPPDGSTVPPDDAGSGQQVISYDIDVEVGKVGEEETLEGVESTTLLPNSKNPILQFVNTDLQGTYGIFIVSPSVTGADGDGNCSPSRQQCHYLKLAVGNAEELNFGIKGETYRIELLAINRRIDTLEKVATGTDDVVEPITSATQWMAG